MGSGLSPSPEAAFGARPDYVYEPETQPRSPDAERFDPPVWKARWAPERELAWRDFLTDARERLGARASQLERALWHGGLHCSGVPIDPENPPARVPAGGWVAIYGFVREPEPLALDLRRILHDADGLVAVDKPPWLSMQRTRASFRGSLEDQLQALLDDRTLFAAHRLDRQTSGVALFARGGTRAAELGRAFAERRVTKRYLACVSPAPSEDTFEARGYLGRVAHPARFKFGLFENAAEGRRASATQFRVAARCARGARLEALPETGRTHQLRVHLAAHGTPIAGDDLYGAPYARGAPHAAPRVLLHAAELALQRAGGGWLRLEAPQPEDLREFMC
ncbi:MAG TPA: RluA family pseudouridine synthase [Myxococcota bacterium]|nr:RluA family pseudouridine synthase [Myxococcota bacterium]